MKKSEIIEMIGELAQEVREIKEECSMEISEIKLELLEIRREIEGLRNARHFNPLEGMGPKPEPLDIFIDARWQQIKEEMDKHGAYVGDWPDPTKTTCGLGCEQTSNGKC